MQDDCAHSFCYRKPTGVDGYTNGIAPNPHTHPNHNTCQPKLHFTDPPSHFHIYIYMHMSVPIHENAGSDI